MRDCIEKAVSLGFDEICFTEHIDHGHPSAFCCDCEDYLKGFLSTKPVTQGSISSVDNVEENSIQSSIQTYIINTHTGRFHYESCDSVSEMSDSNKQVEETTRENLIKRGYTPCGNCNP